jgi:membrane protease YdiL (CAAX protease family)
LIPPDPTTPPEPVPGPDGPSGGRPGASTFTIEGRSAPALFVVGWLATLMGLATLFVAFLAGGTTAATVLLIVGLVLLAVGLIAGAGSQGIERRARARATYTGPSPILVFVAAIPVTILAGILIGVPLSLLGVAVDGPEGRLAAVGLQAVIYVALIRLLVVDTGALSWLQMGVRRFDRAAVSELALGALAALPVIIVTAIVAGILSTFIQVQPDSPLPPTGTTSGLLLNLVAGAIIAPIGEELMFRGFATTAWAHDLGPRRAIVQGALFFAVVHILNITGGTAGGALGLAVIGFVARLPVALALGWLFVERRSIWAPIGLHATFNGILLVLAEVALRNGLV